ncbi:MAG: C-terminal binding protein [Chloroflexi bacterium]|nr:C-terminal binding protein [Chloroflexota bacterium]
MSEHKFTVYYMGRWQSEDLSDTRTALEQVGANLELLDSMHDEDEIIEKVRDADGIITSESPITRKVLESLTQCKVVLRTGVGFDVIDVEAATENGIAVVNIPDMWTREVANQAMSLLLGLNRRVVNLHDDIRANSWTPRPPYEVGSLHGETIGILGLGRIGSAMAQRAKGFELDVIAYDPYIGDEAFAERGVTRVSFEDMMSRSDYISLHTPLTDETRHIIDENALRLMKPNAYLINTSRGPVVDEAALIKALQEGWIAGAGLDVLEKEPPDQDNPLLSMNNVILSPHSGHTSVLSLRIRTGRYGEEVATVLDGKKPRNLVNPQVLEHLHLV